MSQAEENAPREGPLRSLFALCFGLSRRVGRRAYAACGLSLMALKYAIDSAIVYAAAGRTWTPLDYLHPVLTARQPEIDPGFGWPLLALAVTSLPFLWIGVSMSMRRALDAGLSPWFGCVFFVPLVNYLMMLLLCVLPSANPPSEASRLARASGAEWRSFLASAAAGAGLGLAMTIFSVFVVGGYAAGLFLGTPFCMGCLTAYLYNRQGEQSVMRTMNAVQLGLLLMGGSLLLFALEGVVCIAMAYPLAVILASLGGLVGQTLAMAPRTSAAPTALVLLALPILTGAESIRLEAPLREVVSAIEIDAPPETVWPNVIGFSELPPPSELVFRLGIAYPRAARIEGHGVGAIRRCEFSTGAFVEPITRWDEPSRLSFDVDSQPHPMQEWSPYQKINAPHLDGSMRSKRGEFRLVRLPNQRTRLEGSTWYELEMFPQSYWTLWSDALVHRIHHRVLAHIKTLSERPADLVKLTERQSEPS